MGAIDFNKIEEDTREQQEEAKKLELEIEQRQEQVEKLENAVADLKTLEDGVDSEGLKKAGEAADRAKGELEEKKQELQERKETLLDQNQETADKVAEAYDGRKKALDKVGLLEMVSEGATEEFKAEVGKIRDALHEDMNRLGSLDVRLQQERKRIEDLDI